MENAIWCRYCAGTLDSGAAIEANDPIWPELQDTAKRAQSDPSVWQVQNEIYGGLAKSQEFKFAFDKWLSAIVNIGVEAALKRFVAED